MPWAFGAEGFLWSGRATVHSKQEWRLTNEDIVDLYNRTPIGAKVICALQLAC